MNSEDPNFLQALRDALKTLSEESGSRGPIRGSPRTPDDFKINELPEFVGSADPEVYLEWERKMDRMFDFKDLDDTKRCKFAILKLGKGASLWYEGVKSKRLRAGKEKISSWESLKRKLRKRYVPTTHRLSTYKRIADFKQGKLSVSEYMEEFENLCLMGQLEEVEEQKMSRFLRGLNATIANTVELCPYSDFDSLCALSLKVESQGKFKYGGGSSSETGKPKYSSSTTQNFNNPFAPPQPIESENSTTAAPIAPKLVTPTKDGGLSKGRCFKCQGFGHFQNACPNKRVVTLREAIECRDELWEEEINSATVFEVSDPGPKEEFSAPDNNLLVLRMLKTQTNYDLLDQDQRDQLFHTKCLVGEKWCSVIIDGGSCTNVASVEMVEKLGLVMSDHPKPYGLHWLNDGDRVKVTKQVRVGLTMGSYTDEITCDVMPMSACHILLGRPWQFDKDVKHHGRSNEYELEHEGKVILLKPMSSHEIHVMNSKKKPTCTLLTKESNANCNGSIVTTSDNFQVGVHSNIVADLGTTWGGKEVAKWFKRYPELSGKTVVVHSLLIFETGNGKVFSDFCDALNILNIDKSLLGSVALFGVDGLPSVYDSQWSKGFLESDGECDRGERFNSINDTYSFGAKCIDLVGTGPENTKGNSVTGRIGNGADRISEMSWNYRDVVILIVSVFGWIGDKMSDQRGMWDDANFLLKTFVVFLSRYKTLELRSIPPKEGGDDADMEWVSERSDVMKTSGSEFVFQDEMKAWRHNITSIFDTTGPLFVLHFDRNEIRKQTSAYLKRFLKPRRVQEKARRIGTRFRGKHQRRGAVTSPRGAEKLSVSKLRRVILFFRGALGV